MTARTAERYQSAQQASSDKITHIQQALDKMQCLLSQERADIGKLSWADAGSLGYISTELDEIVRLWTSTEK